MKDAVEIRFENEGVEGIIPIGSYLADAARRFGVYFDEVCEAETGSHHCRVEISTGADLLSELTAGEREFFGADAKQTERLACHARLERDGEVVVVTKRKEGSEAEEKRTPTEEYRDNFAKLPLDKKISELVQLEAIAFSDTLSYLINSPFAIGNKIIGAMSEFGFRREDKERASARPNEHKAKEAAAEAADEPADEPGDGSAAKDA